MIKYIYEVMTMKKELTFEEILAYPVERVWEVLQDPADIVVEKNVKVEKKDALHWIEHVNATAFNESEATIHADEHKIIIHTINSKYASETNQIILQVSAQGEDTKLTVDYTVGTTALFNIITMEVLGEKIMHHASNTIVKSIKHKLK